MVFLINFLATFEKVVSKAEAQNCPSGRNLLATFEKVVSKAEAQNCPSGEEFIGHF